MWALISCLPFNCVVTMATGDPASLLVSLCDALKGYTSPREWNDMLKERDQEKESANRYSQPCHR